MKHEVAVKRPRLVETWYYRDLVRFPLQAEIQPATFHLFRRFSQPDRRNRLRMRVGGVWKCDLLVKLDMALRSEGLDRLRGKVTETSWGSSCQSVFSQPLFSQKVEFDRQQEFFLRNISEVSPELQFVSSKWVCVDSFHFKTVRMEVKQSVKFKIRMQWSCIEPWNELCKSSYASEKVFISGWKL